MMSVMMMYSTVDTASEIRMAARQRLVRIDGLLGGGGDGVEADEAEEHDRNAAGTMPYGCVEPGWNV